MSYCQFYFINNEIKSEGVLYTHRPSQDVKRNLVETLSPNKGVSLPGLTNVIYHSYYKKYGCQFNFISDEIKPNISQYICRQFNFIKDEIKSEGALCARHPGQDVKRNPVKFETINRALECSKLRIRCWIMNGVRTNYAYDRKTILPSHNCEFSYVMKHRHPVRDVKPR